MQTLVDRHDQAVLAGTAKPLMQVQASATGGGMTAVRAIATISSSPAADRKTEKSSMADAAAAEPTLEAAAATFAAASAAATADASAGASAVSENECIGEKLAPFNPTNDAACNIALDMLRVQGGGGKAGAAEVLYDLGCGDARLLAIACKRFCFDLAVGTDADATKQEQSLLRCVGAEYDRAVFLRAQAVVAAAEAAGDVREGQIQLLHANVLDVDWSAATCLFIYLVPAGMKALCTSTSSSSYITGCC